MADSLSIHWVFSQLGSQKGASVRVRTCYLPAWAPLFALRPKLLQFLQRVPKGKFSHRVVLTLFLIAIQMPNIVFCIFLRNFFRIENFKHINESSCIHHLALTICFCIANLVTFLPHPPLHLPPQLKYFEANLKCCL